MVLNVTHWSASVVPLVFLVHLKSSELFFPDGIPVWTSQRGLYFPWILPLGFQIKAGEWQDQGDLHHFSCRVELPPPSLLYDPASTYDALSHHLHRLQHKSYLASACNPSACSALTAEVIEKERGREREREKEREREREEERTMCNPHCIRDGKST